MLHEKCNIDYIHDNQEVQFDLNEGDYFAGSKSGRKPTDSTNKVIQEHDRVEIWSPPHNGLPSMVIAQGWIKEIQVDAPFDNNARPYMCKTPTENHKYRALIGISGRKEKICDSKIGWHYQGRPVSQHKGYTHTEEEESSSVLTIQPAVEDQSSRVLTTPPNGVTHRQWITSGLTKEGVKVWRVITHDQEILSTKPTWTPLNKFK